MAFKIFLLTSYNYLNYIGMLSSEEKLVVEGIKVTNKGAE